MPTAKHPTAKKEAWLLQWLAQPENHGATVDQVKHAMRLEFDECLGTQRLNDAVTAARAAIRAKGGIAPLPRQKAHHNGHRKNASPQDLLRDLTTRFRGEKLPIREAVTIIKQLMKSSGIAVVRMGANDQVEITLET